MAELHDALSYLGPVSWDTVPTSSPDELRKYAQQIFTKARLAIETVPVQTLSTTDTTTTTTGGGGDSGGNGAAFPKQELLSPLKGLSESQLASLRKEWGKPIKMNNAKENPLNIPMYKMQGKDGKGAWFARRSIHKGLPFGRWKAKMRVELEETLKERQGKKRQSQTPGTSVRGIGGDKKLENIQIRDTRTDDTNKTVGCLEVYKLSAQFPGPTAARDFVTLIMTTETVSEEEEGEENDGDGNEFPPTFMTVSKPCIHPDAPPRDDYVRGQYESVELIRELRTTKKPSQEGNNSPRPASSSKGSDSTGKTSGKTEPAVLSDESVHAADEWNNPNPVEWIMITRSDPGGSVPKWMVERGTPKSITADAVKFLNWASQPDASDKGDTADIVEATKDAENQQRRTSVGSGRSNGRLSGMEETAVADQQPDAIGTGSKGAELMMNQSVADSNFDKDQPSSGLWSSVTSMMNTGIKSYVPQAVSNYIPGHLPYDSDEDGDKAVPTESQVDKQQEDTMSIVSNESFTSAESNIPPSVSETPVPPESGQESTKSSGVSSSSRGINGASSETAIAAKQKDAKAKPTSKEKDLAKLQSRRRDIETKLTTIQSEIEALGGTTTTTTKDIGSAQSDKESDRTSTASSVILDKTHGNAQAVVQDQKRIARLSRTEAKLNSQLRKIEAQQLKLVRKIEARQHKTAEREEKARSRSEVESLRKEVESLKAEVRELRGEREKWLDILNRLQKENARLAAKSSGANLTDSSNE